MDDQPLPTLLYHYTDTPGLLGIVKSQAIWATHIHYLNDAQEFDYAINLAAQVIEEQQRALAEPREREILMHFAGFARFALSTSMMVNQHALPRIPLYVCVASFSEVGDALSQWRAYCPNGAGYSIGFVTEDLVGEAARQGFSLVRCLYDEESQRAAITQALEEVRHSVQWARALDQGTRFGTRFQYKIEVSRVWWDTFAPVAPTIKHRAFHEEQEWRLISAPVPFTDSRWQVRAGRSMLMPYVPITLAPGGASLPIQEVIVGPTPHMDLAVTAAGILLHPILGPMALGDPTAPRKRQLGPIRKSQVPYRNW